jgi:hypothetical protein
MITIGDGLGLGVTTTAPCVWCLGSWSISVAQWALWASDNKIPFFEPPTILRYFFFSRGPFVWPNTSFISKGLASLYKEYVHLEMATGEDPPGFATPDQAPSE